MAKETFCIVANVGAWTQLAAPENTAVSIRIDGHQGRLVLKSTLPVDDNSGNYVPLKNGDMYIDNNNDNAIWFQPTDMPAGVSAMKVWVIKG